MDKYRRVEIVGAEPMNEHDFLMTNPTQPTAAGVLGARPNGYRPGYRLVDADGAVSWMEKNRFERDFAKI